MRSRGHLEFIFIAFWFAFSIGSGERKPKNKKRGRPGNEAGIVSNVPTWFVKVNLCITTGPKKGAGLAHMQLARSNQGMRVVRMHTRVR